MSKRKESGNTKNKKLFLIIFLISTLLMIGGAGIFNLFCSFT